ncbi:LamG-like jellyroll fold domain-containing protein [Streptomyces uncialis]|uniref:LamG domain-containing protein n=1 Tax=Streptomyces uncialis TaxID=1048205 RepID=UPI0038054FCF
MTDDQALLRIYSDRTYTFTTMVRHQGTVVAFALDDRRRIVYTVLDLSSYDEKRGELDAAYWSENPVELPFPDEVVTVGYGVVGTTAMPVVKRGGRTEAADGEELLQEERDGFLSSTARLTADGVPFQVVSDGTHVVVLRQAVGAAHPDAVFPLSGGGCSGDGTRADVVKDASGVKVPLVADTLLCDRFLLVGGALKPVGEVRFRRSRHKSEPESAKDSLGAVDMDGKAFFEPTQELAFIRNLTGGRFAAVLTPTAVQGQQRWQFFAHNQVTGRIDSFNVEQGTDGLFNTQGSRFWTSPDERYRASVFEREPGTCPFTGEALVPVTSETRHAESALRFNGSNAYVDLGAAPALKFTGRAYAVEAWIRPDAAGGPVVARWSGAGQGGFRLRVTGTGQVVLDHGTGSLTATQTITAGQYAHVAVSFDGTVATVYVNGAFSGSAALAYGQDGTAGLRIGAAQGGGFFAGVIDEVRIWKRGRAQHEVAEERVHRLIGNEPGLAAYYRLDEGAGLRVYDQTDGAVHGTVAGAGEWVTSQAPVGDHPGVRRDSFTLAGRDVVSGLSASLYYQQEEAVSGYDDAAKPAKRQARVLLACATRPSGDTAADAHLAGVDFGVGVDGRLADVPDVVALSEIGRPVEESADQVTAQEQKVGQLQQEVKAVQDAIAPLVVEKAQLEAEIAQISAGGAEDPTKWAVWVHSIDGGWLVYRGSSPCGTGVSTRAQNRWQFRSVPGAEGRYGNPRVTMVGLDAGSTATSAQWYLKGNLTTSFQLQDVNTDLWFNGWTTVPEMQYRFIGRAEKIGMAPDAQLALKQDRLAVVVPLLTGLEQDLAVKRAELGLANEVLAALTGSLLGAADLVLPVPNISVDANGLSCAGALLKFARSAATPHLVDSAAGRVALYFRGANGQMFAAYLDTSAVRGVQQIAAAGVTALFTARDPGLDLGSGTQIRITDATVNGATAVGLCDLTVTRGAETETFARLPRRARDLAAIVNGVPDEPVQVGTVASVAGDQVNLTQPAAVAVPAYGYLWIGGASHLVTAAAVVGATTLRVTPAPSAGITPGTVVSLVRYDTARASASQPGVSLTRGSRWITVSADKAESPVPNGVATVRVSGYGSRWRGDSPGRAFAFNGTGHRLSLPAGRLDQVTVPAGDLTTEAWIKPSTVASAGARVVHVNRDTTKAALALSREALGGGAVFNGTEELLIDPWNPLAGDFTIECWVKRTPGRTVADPVVAIEYDVLVMGFTADGKFQFTLKPETGAADVLTTATSYTDSEWHHWAITFNRATRVQTIVRDGVEVARRTAASLPRQRVNVVVGRDTTDPYKRFSGSMAELRAWTTVRTAAEINADRHRRVTAAEPGLAGSWIWDAAQPAARRLRNLNGTGPHGIDSGSGGPAACDSPLSEYRVLAAVGDKVRQSREKFACGEWAHLAAVHEQSWALRFDGGSWADTPDADALDITGDLTIEVFASIDAIGVRQGLVSKGRLGAGTGGSVPYQLSVLADGKLEFAFEEAGPVVKRFTSATAVTTGFHRIAVVRKAGTTTQEVKGKRSFPVTNASGTTTSQEFDVVERVDVEEWQDIRFVVDGTVNGTNRYTGPGSRGNDGALEIGRAREGAGSYPFKGTIGDVRIWGKARENNQLGTALQPRDDGLIARWTFEENDGNTTADLAGGYDLRLRGARWTTDPDPRASTFTLYRDGRAIPSDTPATNPLAEWGDEQLTLGALNKTGVFREFFQGTLEEVRLWRTARTPEQILDNLFTRLKGDKQDLLGYWPFDSDSTTATAETVADHSLRGNHLDPGTDTTRPRIVLSTAPVSTDTAAVRSALAGVRTPFHETATAGPAAAEYADLQYTPSGEAYGVLKRSYSHLKDGTWRLTTGFKVGDLISEWVSQVQFDPQLIGYIEGAPPVPSENLTGGTDPAGCSKVTFQQADEVTSTLSSARERSVDTAFSVAAATEIDQETLLILAPLGFGTAMPLFEARATGGIGGSIEFSNGWTDETSLSQGTSTDRNTSATLTGAWEDPGALLNDAIGRRYAPANNGYALVQSETADVYALRLAHTGDLVAYRMMPNPDIPKDWNIISFPLNPQYTKQGTLDGAVGFNARGKVLDPAYPNATRRGEYSYFKPREAYAIKRRILREKQQLESYYNSVSTETSKADPTVERAGKLLDSFVGAPPAPDAKQPTATADAFANRNIANTYVWTADGGFFAETTGTVDVVTQTTGGSYTFSGKATGTLETGFEVAGVGIGLQFEASLGGGTSVTRARTREATRSHSLEVECNPTRDLQKYDDQGKPLYTAGKPVLVPGKVDAYRFMTFYLGQDTTHFDDFYNKVADPTWLTNSNHPSAAALRQARHSDRKPPCWRVLHRVTYISRILPPVPPADAPPLEKALHDVDVTSNYELIRRLDPYVSTATASRAELADATRTALTTHLPKLLPHAAEIAQFLADYYGIPD